MRLLIAGGCKNGKSTLAQRIAALQGDRRAYVATMRPQDGEDLERIARHRREREGWGFETLEVDGCIERVANMLPPDTSVLLDSATAQLAWEMFGPDGRMDPQAGGRVEAGLLSLARAFENIVIVSDTIYADALDFAAETEAYRRALAMIERALARECDGVIEMAFGQWALHKGAREVAELVEAAAGAGHGAGPVYRDTGVRSLG